MTYFTIICSPKEISSKFGGIRGINHLRYKQVEGYVLRDTCPYALSCPLSLTSDPVLGWSMSEKSLVTCSGSWAFGRHIEFKMAPNFSQNAMFFASFSNFFSVLG